MDQVGAGDQLVAHLLVLQHVPDRVEDHPLGRLDPAEHDHRRVGDDVIGRQTAGVDGVGQQRGARTDHRSRAPASAAARSSRRRPPTSRSDRRRRLPPSRRWRRTSAAGRRPTASSAPSRPSVWATTAAATGPASCDRSSAVRAEEPATTSSRRSTTVGDEGLEALLDAPWPKRPGEGLAMTGVLVAIGRQHAPADHPRRREPGIIDGERRRIVQHGDRRLATGDEPGSERRHASDGSTCPQPRQVGVRVLGELGQRQVVGGHPARYPSATAPSASACAPTNANVASGVSGWNGPPRTSR